MQQMKMAEGGSVEEYLKKAREIRNRVTNMEETITSKALIQLVLNGLPHSFESTIQGLIHRCSSLTFDLVYSSLITYTLTVTKSGSI